jgi:hypothetical protein
MPEEPTIDPELTRLAASLAGLTPATPALDRDRLFYEAGRRTHPIAPRPWSWPLATALTASLVFGLGARLALVPVPERGPDVAELKLPAPVSPPAVAVMQSAGEDLQPSANAVRRREQMILWDSEAPPSIPDSIATESLESQFGIGAGGLTESQRQRFKTALSRGDL